MAADRAVDGTRRHTPGAWWRRRGLRGRLTLAASAGVAVALAAAGLLLLIVLRGSLTDELDSNARQAADQVVTLVNANALPNPVPFGQGTLSVQVIDSRGFVVAASAQSDRVVPLLAPAVAYPLARSGQATQLNGQPFGIAARCGWWRWEPTTARWSSRRSLTRR